MDERGLGVASFAFVCMFGALVASQFQHLRSWLGQRTPPPGYPQLAASTTLALMGYLCWLRYYWVYQATGAALEFWAVLARGGVIAAKTVTSILLMLLAYGECVCRPGVDWAKRRELVWSMVVFGWLGFALETWGDSQAKTSSTEYIYDTRPGVALVAIDLLWLYVFCSRCLRTFQVETRPRPRRFYRQYAPFLSIWFASLPLVALLAAVLAPWVRAGVTFVVNGLAHVFSMGVLVYSFHPSLAPDLYEIRDWDHEAGKADIEELTGLLKGADEEMF